MPSQEDIEAQLKLLAANRQTLEHYLIQRDTMGSAYIPPAVSHGIREARKNIRRIKTVLRDQGITVEDLSIDEEPSPDALTDKNQGYIAKTSPRTTVKRLRIAELVGLSATIMACIAALVVIPEVRRLLTTSVSTPALATTATITMIQNQIASVISTTDLYSLPNIMPNPYSSTFRRTLPAGTIVQVLSIKDNWALIRARQKRDQFQEGWLPINILDLSITPTPTPIPSTDSVRLNISNPNERNILIIIEGAEIGEMEIEVSVGSTMTIYLPAGNYTYQVYTEYTLPDRPPAPTPTPRPGLCAHYQGEFVLISGKQQTLEILRMGTEQGKRFFAGCPQSTPTPL